MEAQWFHSRFRCQFQVVASRVPFSEVDTDEPVFPFSATTVPSFGITDGEQHCHEEPEWRIPSGDTLRTAHALRASHENRLRTGGSRSSQCVRSCPIGKLSLRL